MAQYNFHIGDVVSSCVNSEREMTIVDINNDGITYKWWDEISNNFCHNQEEYKANDLNIVHAYSNDTLDESMLVQLRSGGPKMKIKGPWERPADEMDQLSEMFRASQDATNFGDLICEYEDSQSRQYSHAFPRETLINIE